MANIIALPYEYFANPTKSGPLFNAQIYIGVVDTDPLIPANRVDVFYVQEDNTQVVLPQPIRTNSGGFTVNGAGEVVQIRTASDYSIRVFDRLSTEITQYNIPNNSESGGASIEYVNGRFEALSTESVTSTNSTTPRTLGDRFADVTNVKDFGAIGDGVADDTLSIQAAINFALANQTGSVYLPNGDYRITNTLLINMNGADLRLFGPGWRAGARLLGVGLNTDIIEITASSGGSQATVENLQIQGQQLGGGSGNGIYVHDCQSVSIQNCWISTMPSYGINIDNVSDLYVRRTNLEFVNGGMRINGATFSNIQAAIYFSSAHGVYATGMVRSQIDVQVVDTNQNGIWLDESCENVSVKGIVRGTPAGQGVLIDDSTHINITDLFTINSGRNGILVANSSYVNVSNIQATNSNQSEGGGFSGVQLSGCAGCQVSNIMVVDDQETATQQYGVFINGAGNVDTTIFGVSGSGNVLGLVQDTGLRTDRNGVVRATSDMLRDVNDPINADRKFAGKEVLDTTTRRKLYTVSSGAGQSWFFMDGTVAFNPV